MLFIDRPIDGQHPVSVRRLVSLRSDRLHHTVALAVAHQADALRELARSEFEEVAQDGPSAEMFDKAKKNLEENIYPAYSLEEAKQLQKERGGFIKTMWCGEEACEIKMKEEAGMSSRCMPLTQEHLSDVCPICGKPAKTMIYWGVAY